MKKDSQEFNIQGMMTDLPVGEEKYSSMFAHKNVNMYFNPKDGNTPDCMYPEKGNYDAIPTQAGTATQWTLLPTETIVAETRFEECLYVVTFDTGTMRLYVLRFLDNDAVSVNKIFQRAASYTTLPETVDIACIRTSENITKCYVTDNVDGVLVGLIKESDKDKYDVQPYNLNVLTYYTVKNITSDVTFVSPTPTTLTSGKIRYYAYASDEAGRSTLIMPVSNEILISSDNRGLRPDETATKAISLRIDIDAVWANFKTVTIYAVHVSEKGTTYRIIPDVVLSNHACTVIDAGQGEVITADEFLDFNNDIYTVKSLCVANDRLVLAGVKCSEGSILDDIIPASATLNVSTGQRTLALNRDIANQLYPYTPFVNGENEIIRSGETYRLGFYGVTREGVKTPVYYVTDFINDSHPVYDAENKAYNVATLKVTLTADVVVALFNAGIIKIVPVFAEHTYADRTMVTQGIISPTLIPVGLQKPTGLTAINSWAMRPSQVNVATGDCAPAMHWRDISPYAQTQTGRGYKVSTVKIADGGTYTAKFAGGVTPPKKGTKLDITSVDVTISGTSYRFIPYNGVATVYFNRDGGIDVTAKTYVSTTAVNPNTYYAASFHVILNGTDVTFTVLKNGSAYNKNVKGGDSVSLQNAIDNREVLTEYPLSPLLAPGGYENDGTPISDRIAEAGMTGRFCQNFNVLSLHSPELDNYLVPSLSQQCEMMIVGHAGNDNTAHSSRDQFTAVYKDTLMQGESMFGEIESSPLPRKTRHGRASYNDGNDISGYAYTLPFDGVKSITPLLGQTDLPDGTNCINSKIVGTYRYLTDTIFFDGIPVLPRSSVGTTVQVDTIYDLTENAQKIYSNNEDPVTYYASPDIVIQTPTYAEEVYYKTLSGVLCTYVTRGIEGANYSLNNFLYVGTTSGASPKPIVRTDVVPVSYKGNPHILVRLGTYSYGDTVVEYTLPQISGSTVVSDIPGYAISFGDSLMAAVAYDNKERGFMFWQDNVTDALSTTCAYYICDIRQTVFNRFGGTSRQALLANTWYEAGDPVTVGGGPIDIEYVRGKSYLTRYDCMKSEPLNDSGINRIVDITSVMIESLVNCDMRYDRNRGLADSVTLNSNNFNLIDKTYVYNPSINNSMLTVYDTLRNNQRGSIYITPAIYANDTLDKTALLRLSHFTISPLMLGEAVRVVGWSSFSVLFCKNGIAKIDHIGQGDIQGDEVAQAASREQLIIPISVSHRLQSFQSVCAAYNGVVFIEKETSSMLLLKRTVTSIEKDAIDDLYQVSKNEKLATVFNAPVSLKYDQYNDVIYIFDKSQCLSFGMGHNIALSFHDFTRGDRPLVDVLTIGGTRRALTQPSSNDDTVLWNFSKTNQIYGGKLMGKPYGFKMRVLRNKYPTLHKIFGTVEFDHTTNNYDDNTPAIPDTMVDSVAVQTAYQYASANATNISVVRRFHKERIALPRDGNKFVSYLYGFVEVGLSEVGVPGTYRSTGIMGLTVTFYIQ